MRLAYAYRHIKSVYISNNQHCTTHGTPLSLLLDIHVVAVPGKDNHESNDCERITFGF